DTAAEKAHYDRHDNDPADPRYRRFLSRAADALMARIDPPARGLDFGSGPGPTLSVMLEEAGYTVALYDKVYAPDPAPFNANYDFITATEVFEHLDAPAETIELLLDSLRPGGWLIIMTKRAGDYEAFTRWHYTGDPTHITFFSEETFRWVARRWNLGLEIAGPDVVALCKVDQKDQHR
ncbi:MAG: class I SAM-dependent methyltransferase, partial [Halofilum sp. (in: g-proteobacteria)]